VIILVYEIIFYVSAVTDVSLNFAQTNTGGAGGAPVNLMSGAASANNGNIQAGNAAGGNGGSELRRWPSVAPNTSVIVNSDQGFVFGISSSSTFCGLEAKTANVALSASFFWAEIPKTGYS